MEQLVEPLVRFFVDLLGAACWVWTSDRRDGAGVAVAAGLLAAIIFSVFLAVLYWTAPPLSLAMYAVTAGGLVVIASCFWLLVG